MSQKDSARSKLCTLILQCSQYHPAEKLDDSQHITQNNQIQSIFMYVRPHSLNGSMSNASSYLLYTCCQSCQRPRGYLFNPSSKIPAAVDSADVGGRPSAPLPGEEVEQTSSQVKTAVRASKALLTISAAAPRSRLKPRRWLTWSTMAACVLNPLASILMSL